MRDARYSPSAKVEILRIHTWNEFFFSFQGTEALLVKQPLVPLKERNGRTFSGGMSCKKREAGVVAPENS